MTHTTEHSSAEQHYDSISNQLQRLAEEVVFALESSLGKKTIKMHNVSSRVKTKKSFLDKIERKGYENPREQVQDLVGARMVCLFITDLPELRELVHSLFEIVSEEDKVEGGPADTFGYMSVHYICRLKPETEGPRYDNLQNIHFEIQCRTLLMDAWANVSHYLAYKGEASIPAELRREFHALAGLFYVADRHFELLSEGSKESDKAALDAFADGGQDSQTRIAVAINRSTMIGFLASNYPDREPPSKLDASEFVEEVALLGYEDMSVLSADLAKVDRAATAYELENPPGSPDEDEFISHFDSEGDLLYKGPLRYTAVGIARMALAIARPDYAKARQFDEETFQRFR